jgi:hypothetical protein
LSEAQNLPHPFCAAAIACTLSLCAPNPSTDSVHPLVKHQHLQFSAPESTACPTITNQIHNYPYKNFELPMSMSNAPLFVTTQENENPQESSLTLGTSKANKKGLTDRLQSLILCAR